MAVIREEDEVLYLLMINLVQTELVHQQNDYFPKIIYPLCHSLPAFVTVVLTAEIIT